MSKINWYTTLLSSNTNYKLYTRANNSHFVMDTGPRLEVLDIHSQFLDILKDSDAGYYYINVKQEKRNNQNMVSGTTFLHFSDSEGICQNLWP